MLPLKSQLLQKITQMQKIWLLLVQVWITYDKKSNNFEYGGAYSTLGMDNALDLTKFADNLSISVIAKRKEELELEINGIDAPIANALRRIMIDEVR